MSYPDDFKGVLPGEGPAWPADPPRLMPMKRMALAAANVSVAQVAPDVVWLCFDIGPVRTTLTLSLADFDVLAGLFERCGEKMAREAAA